MAFDQWSKPKLTQLYVTKGFFPDEYFHSTVDYIAKLQWPDGGIPWQEGAKLDPWDHVEAAMGLTIGGQFDAARRAYTWMADNQLPNGSWFASYNNGEVEDGTRAESNFVAYIATGVWHYYLITEDTDFLHYIWPTVERAVDFVLGLQGEYGEIYWCLDSEKGIHKDALVTGCSSIYKSLECALNIATQLDKSVPHWSLARTRLRHALLNHPECFDRTWESKRRYSMDWYYPVFTGVISENKAQAHLQARWHTFVVPSLGCRCVADQPWVTVAESCELTLALVAAGEYNRAAELFSWLHQFRDDNGAYWTGYVYPDKAIWPEERSTWTAAAVLLAADALSEVTAASGLFTSAELRDPAQQSKRIY